MSNTVDFYSLDRKLNANGGANAPAILNDLISKNQGISIKDNDKGHYFFWDVNQNYLVQVTPFNDGYEVKDSDPYAMASHIKDEYNAQNKDKIDALRNQKEPLSLLDKFLGIFGYKTDRVRRNERVDDTLLAQEIGYVQDRMVKSGIKNKDLMLPELSQKDKQLAELSGDALTQYVRTGVVPEQKGPNVKPNNMNVTQQDVKKKWEEIKEKKLKARMGENAYDTVKNGGKLINTTFDHMMSSISRDKVMDDMQKKRVEAAAGMICKYYNDKLFGVAKKDPKVDFTVYDDMSLQYLANCSSKNLLKVCSKVAWNLPSNLNDKEKMLNTDTNVVDETIAVMKKAKLDKTEVDKFVYAPNEHFRKPERFKDNILDSSVFQI